MKFYSIVAALGVAAGAGASVSAREMPAAPVSCEAHFFAAGESNGQWGYEQQPYASAILHLGHPDNREMIYFRSSANDHTVMTAPGTAFPEASEMLAGLSSFANVPPVWRGYMEAAAREIDGIPTRQHVDLASERLVTYLLIWIPEADPDANIPAGAVAGIGRLPQREGEGWLYAFIFARDCA